MNKIIFVLLISLFSQLVSAQTTVREYEFLARAQTVVIENAEFIRLNMQYKLVEVLTKRPELLTKEDPTELIHALEELASQGLPARSKVKLDELAKNLIGDSVKEVRTIIRKHGMAIGISYAAISLASYGSAMLFAAIGQVQIAALLSVVPTGTIFLVSSLAITRLIKYNNTLKLYGGKENYRYFKKLNKEVMKSLKLQGKQGLLIPLEEFSEDSYLAVSVKNNNLLNTLADLVDHSRSTLTAKQLEYFLDRHDAWTTGLENISKTALSSGLKAASMLHHIQSVNPPLFEKLQQEFPKSFVDVPAHVFSQGLKEWALASARVRSREEILNAVDLIPVGEKVIDVLKIWTKCVVPLLLEEGKNLTYKGYRGLSKSSDRFNVEAELNANAVVDVSWKQKFYQDLFQVLDMEAKN